MSLLRPFALVTSVLVLGACQRRIPEPEPEQREAPVAASSAAEPEPPPPPQPNVTQLKKEDLKVGTGPEVNKGDRVKVHYTGRLLDGTKFDSSLDRDEPFEFGVGAGEVIKGWDEGLIGMKKGGKRKLTIPSEKAYGKMGSPPKIPPDAPLEFEIELIEIL